MTPTSIPVAPGDNLLGHGHLFQDDRLPFFRRVTDQGDLVAARMVHRSFYFVNGPQVAHEMLVEKARSFEKSPGIRILLHDLAGQGLFTSEGDLWRRQRRLLSPLFHPTQLQTYVGAMNGEALRARERLKEGERTDLAAEMTRIAMSVVGRALFDARTFDEADELGEALTVALGWVNDRMATPYMTLQVSALEMTEYLDGKLPPWLEDVRARARAALDAPILMPGRNDPTVVKALEVLDKRIQAMIDDRRASHADRKDLLTRLLYARDADLGGEGMSDKQVRDEANTLFIAGHETTATALAWSFYLLARDPAARAKVQAEADAFGPEGPTSYDPEKLAYTTRVFKEALRLYPPVIVLPRRALERVELGGHTFPERTILFVNVYGMHHRKDLFPDPERFDPDRFSPENEAKRHKSAWVPFGVGPRVCIGNHFALMEGPVVLATLMRGLSFEVEPQDVEPETFTTLRPKGGIWARVRRRSAL
ncbi:cytochrome P450 [Polyangium sorediatum]|uniref:Cytochrome P450 n=1 Tax=Polyangium sorediatum TaxID=889274 RepID=A0ABT6P0Y3_9BACT|nr:cytochrome P450 [Polyangium sorediatum]MDI1434271.1 cytochrome P450 [Polyangium sorediatum]